MHTHYACSNNTYDAHVDTKTTHLITSPPACSFIQSILMGIIEDEISASKARGYNA